jgi:hypothetical protein
VCPADVRYTHREREKKGTGAAKGNKIKKEERVTVDGVNRIGRMERAQKKKKKKMGRREKGRQGQTASSYMNLTEEEEENK